MSEGLSFGPDGHAGDPIPAAERVLHRSWPFLLAMTLGCGAVSGIMFRVWVIDAELIRHLIAHFVGVPLFLVGFAYGSRWMLLCGAVATGVAALVRAAPVAADTAWDPDGWWYLLVFGLLIALPCVWLVHRSIVLRVDKGEVATPSRFSRVFLEIIVYFLVVVGGCLLWIHFTSPQGAVEWLYQQVLQYLTFALSHPLQEMLKPLIEAELVRQGQPVTEQNVQMMTVTATFSTFRWASEVVAFHAAGAFSAAIISLGLINARFGLMLTGMVADRRLAEPDMLDLRVPLWLPIVFIVAVLLRVFALDLGQALGDEALPNLYTSAYALVRFVALTLIWILVLPLMLSGFALVHLAARARRFHHWAAVIPFYGVTGPAVAAVLVATGLLGVETQAEAAQSLILALIVTIVTPCAIAVALGVIDPFTRWRDRQRRRLALWALRQAAG